MQLTLGFFNTYDFFIESAAKAKLTLSLLTYKNKFLGHYPVNVKVNANNNDKKKPSLKTLLKTLLSLKFTTYMLGHNLALSILIFVNKLVPNLSLIAKTWLVLKVNLHDATN